MFYLKNSFAMPVIYKSRLRQINVSFIERSSLFLFRKQLTGKLQQTVTANCIAWVWGGKPVRGALAWDRNGHVRQIDARYITAFFKKSNMAPPQKTLMLYKKCVLALARTAGGTCVREGHATSYSHGFSPTHLCATVEPFAVTFPEVNCLLKNF